MQVHCVRNDIGILILKGKWHFSETFQIFVSFSLVSQVTDSHRTAATNGQTDHALNSGSYPVTQSSQSPPYTTPLSTKTELRSTRDHHVVDVRQQNTVVPTPQQAHARSDKPSKLEILIKIFLYIIILRIQYLG